MSKHRSRDGKIYSNLHDATVANRAHDAIARNSRYRFGYRPSSSPTVEETVEVDLGYTHLALKKGESVSIVIGETRGTLFSYEDLKDEALVHRVTVTKDQEIWLTDSESSEPLITDIEHRQLVCVFSLGGAYTDAELDAKVKSYFEAEQNSNFVRGIESGLFVPVFVSKEG